MQISARCLSQLRAGSASLALVAALTAAPAFAQDASNPPSPSAPTASGAAQTGSDQQTGLPGTDAQSDQAPDREVVVTGTLFRGRPPPPRPSPC